MEKISQIVPSNARVASVDMKSSSSVRPGTPTFGRPVGESPHTSDRMESTASKAAALQNELKEKRDSSQSRIVSQMADNFFMSRNRRADEDVAAEPALAALKTRPAAEKEFEVESTGDLLLGENEAGDVQQPPGFKPRGSYVNVRA